MEHDCATRTVAGATLVTVRLRNGAAVPRRVRVRNDLPGPVLPPRREGVPERGWDDEGFTGVVAAGDERTLGYACPATADRATPVSVESLGRADGGGVDSAAELEAEAVRSLGRARPPADAVPTSAVASHRRSDRPPGGAPNRSPDDVSDPVPTTDDSAVGADGDVDGEGNRCGDEAERGDGPDVPDTVASWLAAVETRVGRVERLTDATADDAAAVLESAGDVTGLPAAVAADEEALRAVAARATALADRAAAADPEPVVDAVGEL